MSALDASTRSLAVVATRERDPEPRLDQLEDRYLDHLRNQWDTYQIAMPQDSLPRGLCGFVWMGQLVSQMAVGMPVVEGQTTLS